jgi:non-ribosomal peptide synthetase component E (peptide arylation enzyme)
MPRQLFVTARRACFLPCGLISGRHGGERICAALVLRRRHSLVLEDLRQWGKERLAPYKVPTRLLLLSELPRNVMGKLTKPEIVKLFER